MTGFVLMKQQKTLLEKGENAGNQHFLLFPTKFSQDFFHGIFETKYWPVKR